MLKEHDGVYFRLRCRKFVEMVRKAAEMSNGDSSAAPPPRNGTLGRDDMELDDEMMDADDGALAASSSSGFNLTREMETVRLLQETLAYGQELAAEFKDDGRPEVAKALDDIFALIAYPNPLKAKEVSHLLDRNGRAAVAEELNSAILCE